MFCKYKMEERTEKVFQHLFILIFQDCFSLFSVAVAAAAAVVVHEQKKKNNFPFAVLKTTTLSKLTTVIYCINMLCILVLGHQIVYL